MSHVGSPPPPPKCFAPPPPNGIHPKSSRGSSLLFQKCQQSQGWTFLCLSGAVSGLHRGFKEGFRRASHVFSRVCTRVSGISPRLLNFEILGHETLECDPALKPQQFNLEYRLYRFGVWGITVLGQAIHTRLACGLP